MKKLIVLSLIITMLFSTVSCGQKNNITNSDGNSVTDHSATLKVWCIQSPAVTDYATNAQSIWTEEQTGISVEYIDVPQNGWADSFRNYIMSGETADIYLYDFDTTEVTNLAQMGGIIPLEDLIDKHAPNIKAMFQNNSELADALTAPDGHIYTLFGRSYNQTEFTQKVFVNREWLQSYQDSTGKGMPETIDDLHEMLLFFKKNDMNRNGDKNDEIPMMGMNGVDAVYYFLGSFITSNSSEPFGCYKDDNGKLSFAYNKKAFKNALSFVKQLYDEGLYSDESFTIDANNRYKYTSGTSSDAKIGVVSGPTISSVVQLSSKEGSLDYDSYVALPPVAGPEGVRTIVSRGAETISMRCAISSSCKDPETAIKWLDFCYSEEARLFSVYGGVEGIDWHYEEGETISGKGKIVVQDSKDTENFAWQGDHCVTYQITEDDITKMDAKSIGQNSVLATYYANRAYRKYAVERQWPAIVWAGDNQDIADEYSNLSSALIQSVTDYYTAVVLGKKDLNDDWKSYVSQLKKIGVDRYFELCEIYISAGE